MTLTGALTPADVIAHLTATGERHDQTPRKIHGAITGGFHAEGVPL